MQCESCKTFTWHLDRMSLLKNVGAEQHKQLSGGMCQLLLFVILLLLQVSWKPS